MDTTTPRSNLNSAHMACGLAQRPEYRDLMTAAPKLTGERVNRFTHGHSIRGREAVCAGVNCCGSPGRDLVLVVRGYQIRCADIGQVTGRNVLYLWFAEELMQLRQDRSPRRRRPGKVQSSTHSSTKQPVAGWCALRLVIDKVLFDQAQTRLCKRKQCYLNKVNCGALF